MKMNKILSILIVMIVMCGIVTATACPGCREDTKTVLVNGEYTTTSESICDVYSDCTFADSTTEDWAKTDLADAIENKDSFWAEVKGNTAFWDKVNSEGTDDAIINKVPPEYAHELNKNKLVVYDSEKLNEALKGDNSQELIDNLFGKTGESKADDPELEKIVQNMDESAIKKFTPAQLERFSRYLTTTQRGFLKAEHLTPDVISELQSKNNNLDGVDTGSLQSAINDNKEFWGGGETPPELKLSKLLPGSTLKFEDGSYFLRNGKGQSLDLTSATGYTAEAVDDGSWKITGKYSQTVRLALSDGDYVLANVGSSGSGYFHVTETADGMTVDALHSTIQNSKGFKIYAESMTIKFDKEGNILSITKKDTPSEAAVGVELYGKKLTIDDDGKMSKTGESQLTCEGCSLYYTPQETKISNGGEFKTTSELEKLKFNLHASEAADVVIGSKTIDTGSGYFDYKSGDNPEITVSKIDNDLNDFKAFGDTLLGVTAKKGTVTIKKMGTDSFECTTKHARVVTPKPGSKITSKDNLITYESKGEVGFTLGIKEIGGKDVRTMQTDEEGLSVTYNTKTDGKHLKVSIEDTLQFRVNENQEYWALHDNPLTITQNDAAGNERTITIDTKSGLTDGSLLVGDGANLFDLTDTGDQELYKQVATGDNEEYKYRMIFPKGLEPGDRSEGLIEGDATLTLKYNSNHPDDSTQKKTTVIEMSSSIIKGDIHINDNYLFMHNAELGNGDELSISKNGKEILLTNKASKLGRDGLGPKFFYPANPDKDESLGAVGITTMKDGKTVGYGVFSDGKVVVIENDGQDVKSIVLPEFNAFVKPADLKQEAAVNEPGAVEDMAKVVDAIDQQTKYEKELTACEGDEACIGLVNDKFKIPDNEKITTKKVDQAQADAEADKKSTEDTTLDVEKDVKFTGGVVWPKEGEPIQSIHTLQKDKDNNVIVPVPGAAENSLVRITLKDGSTQMVKVKNGQAEFPGIDQAITTVVVGTWNNKEKGIFNIKGSAVKPIMDITTDKGVKQINSLSKDVTPGKGKGPAVPADDSKEQEYLIQDYEYFKKDWANCVDKACQEKVKAQYEGKIDPTDYNQFVPNSVGKPAPAKVTSVQETLSAFSSAMEECKDEECLAKTISDHSTSVLPDIVQSITKMARDRINNKDTADPAADRQEALDTEKTAVQNEILAAQPITPADIGDKAVTVDESGFMKYWEKTSEGWKSLSLDDYNKLGIASYIDSDVTAEDAPEDKKSAPEIIYLKTMGKKGELGEYTSLVQNHFDTAYLLADAQTHFDHAAAALDKADEKLIMLKGSADYDQAKEDRDAIEQEKRRLERELMFAKGTYNGAEDSVYRFKAKVRFGKEYGETASTKNSKQKQHEPTKTKPSVPGLAYIDEDNGDVIRTPYHKGTTLTVALNKATKTYKSDDMSEADSEWMESERSSMKLAIGNHDNPPENNFMVHYNTPTDKILVYFDEDGRGWGKRPGDVYFSQVDRYGHTYNDDLDAKHVGIKISKPTV